MTFKSPKNHRLYPPWTLLAQASPGLLGLDSGCLARVVSFCPLCAISICFKPSDLLQKYCSSDVLSLSPWLSKRKLLLVSHAAESSEISNKARHPFVARMSTSITSLQAGRFVDIIRTINHTAAKLLACDDAYCRDCATNFRATALDREVRVHQEALLPLGSFRNDVDGRFAASMLTGGR